MKKNTKNTTIFFLRHGQPDNPKKLIKGTADFKLTPLGKKQIQIQANRLLSERIGGLFTSPVLRCVQTAEIVAKALNEDRTQTNKQGQPIGPGGLRVRKVNELIEWTSRFDGQVQAKAHQKGEKEFVAGFEPHEQVIGRMKQFVAMVFQKYFGQTVIGVSHQGPIDLLLMSLQKEDYSHTPYQALTTKKGEMVKAIFNPQGELVSLERFLPKS